MVWVGLGGFFLDIRYVESLDGFICYDANYIPESVGVTEIRKLFNLLIEEEVMCAQYVFAAGKSKRKPRKSSMLRAANRRLSDTNNCCYIWPLRV